MERDAGNSADYVPELPIQLGSLHQRPLRIAEVLRSLFGVPGYILPWQAIFLCIAYASWRLIASDDGKLSTHGVLIALGCNVTALGVFVTLLHVHLYGRKAQGTQYKYNSHWLAMRDPRFLFASQLWDNVFWTMCSAVPIWTVYEILTLWLQTRGYVRTTTWQAHPVYCALLILLSPLWAETHFYLIHRLLHWRPLYRSAHYLHHNNINFGPWSGVAMHPVEHLLFFSSVTLFWLLPATPLNAIYLLTFAALGPSTAHLGFHRVMFGKTLALNNDHYMHYLHHKHVNVNYGNDLLFLPFDKWFGTFHDGSPEAHAALKARMKAKAVRKRAGRVLSREESAPRSVAADADK